MGEPIVLDEDMKEIIESFVAESLDSIEQVESHYMNLENCTNKEIIHTIFRTFHSIKGSTGFLEFNNINELTHETETFLQLFRKHELVIDEGHVDLLYKVTDLIKQMIYQVEQKYHDQGFEQDKLAYVKEIQEHINELQSRILDHQIKAYHTEHDNGAVKPEKAEAAGPVQKEAAEAGEDFFLPGEGAEAVSKEADRIISESMDSTDFLKDQKKDIRVNLTKLDTLFDLVGELIITESILNNSLTIEQKTSEALSNTLSSMNKITRELQEITTTIRMIPLEGLFNRMKRLVRGMGQKTSKRVNLTVIGEDTEMDRNVMELITNPLVHLIRNAIDHGIEEKEKRTGAGKSEAGSLLLEARYEGSEIWIIIEDDGQGLNREKILAKALEKGLVQKKPEELSDNDVWQLIFEPGFSTAEKITDVSGRGVGMDVVKKNINKIGGIIDIESKAGKGTCITLKIPLTLAIIDGITTRVGKLYISIPTYDIVEFYRKTDQNIIKTEEKYSSIKIRNEVLPLINLNTFFNLHQEETKEDRKILVVVQYNNRKACYLVDQIVGSQQIVVKSLSGYLGNVKGINGCSVLGNGDISYIIDTSVVFKKVLE